MFQMAQGSSGRITDDRSMAQSRLDARHPGLVSNVNRRLHWACSLTTVPQGWRVEILSMHQIRLTQMFECSLEYKELRYTRLKYTCHIRTYSSLVSSQELSFTCECASHDVLEPGY